MGNKRPTFDRKDSLWSRDDTPPIETPICLPQPLYPRIQGETPPYRSVRALRGLRRVPEPGVNTVFDLVRRSAEKYGSRLAVGSRTTVSTHTRQTAFDADGKRKTLSVAELTGYAFTTYRDYEKLVSDLGSGLVNAGLKPKEDKLCIWAQTCVDWLAMFHGACSQAMPIVTAYSSLGLSGIQHALTSTEASGMFVDSQGLERLDAALRAAPQIRLVVYSGDAKVLHKKCFDLTTEFRHVRFLHIDELRAFGRQKPAKLNDPVSEDLCAIFYTSGSTGNPKGVPLKHKNVVAAVAGWDHQLGRHLGNDDRYLSYLPLAHVIEFTLTHLCLHRGVCIGYGSPRTIFDSGAHDCKGDLRELRPTVMAGVPAIWESVRKATLAMLSTLPPDEQAAFWQALEEMKTLPLQSIFPPNLADSRFTIAREILGGRLKFMLTGGGPIAADTQEFLSYVVAPLVGGFGMTETTAIAGVTDPAEWQSGSLGGVPDCAELKLVDEPTAGYLTSNFPPEGEIWIRSHSATDHYYNDEVETAKAFTVDGWFKTGDIGQIDARGVISVIDRKKNLVKTLNGEYIALEKLEAIYRSCKTVLNVCIYADSRRKKPVAIVLSNGLAIDALSEAQSLISDHAPTTKDNASRQRLVLMQLQERARECDLACIERVEGVVLSRLEEWSPMNGMTTAVGKLDRRGIFAFHKDDVDQLLATLGGF